MERIKDFILDKYYWFKHLSLKQKIGVVGAGVAAVLVIVPLVTYAYFARDIANPDRLMNRNNTGVVLLDKSGEEFYRAYNANDDGEEIPLKKMPEHVRNALIATEDKSFYEHSGYSVRSTLAALYGNILSADPYEYGGSTITQQLAKNALLSNEKSYFRKYQELTIAIAIDRRYSKDKILEMYLNSVYFGEGAFGIEDAAQAYFGKPASKLNRAESSMLVGLLPAPSSLSPISGDKEKANERQKAVLANMAEEGYITEQERVKLAKQKLNYQTTQEEADDTFAQHFANMVLGELEERYGEELIARSGFRVTTTLNRSWQKQAKAAVKEQINQISYANATNGALVAIDPTTGEIKALVGSVDWDNKKFGKVNMATTPRQPGSSFKPIYYTEALAQKVITPATILRDEPTTFGSDYEPENFDFAYRGDITVRSALAQSLNIPSVKVMEKLGVDEAVNAARNMGYENIKKGGNYGLSLALGSAEVELLNHTNAFAALANSGKQFEPTTIRSVQDKYRETIFESEPESKRVVDQDASFLISSILSDDQARAPTFGGSLSLDRPVAVKTGTTDDSKDALTLGYTPNLAVGVWVGNNNHQAMEGLGGSTAAGPIWRQAMQSFLDDLPSQEFQQPPGVVSVLICRSNGLRANQDFPGTYKEYFIQGTVPDGQCQAPPEEPEEEENDEQEDEEDQTDDSENQPAEEEDTTDPTASITSPADSATVSGDVSFSASASDDTGVEKVEFLVDGAVVQTVASSPYGFSWDSTTVDDGPHTLSVTAYDAAGNTASDNISVEVDNSSDSGG